MAKAKDEPLEQTRAPIEPGTFVDHFKVIRLVGRGGMGEVYLARDTKLGRKVALKLINTDWTFPPRPGATPSTERNRLESTRLHGPVIHLSLQGGSLYVATELGDHVVLDLSAFHLGYCDLLRRVWGAVPSVWEGGLPLLRPAPRDHRCALAAAR